MTEPEEWMVNRTLREDGSPKTIAEIVKDFDPNRVIGVIRNETGEIIKRITSTTYHPVRPNNA